MPTLDDEQLETYLKQFRPIVPDALPLREHKGFRRHAVLRLCAVGFATIVILGGVTLHIVSSRVTQKRSNPASVEVVHPAEPLTMRSANALLASAPSYKAAVDRVFYNQRSTIPKDKQSALAVLAKEKIKL